MNAWEFLIDINTSCFFTSREKLGQKASNSELKRWCQNSVLRINGEVMKWDQEIVFPIESCTLFMKKARITLF